MNCVMVGRVLRKRGPVSEQKIEEKSSTESDRVSVSERLRRSRRAVNEMAEAARIKALSIDTTKSVNPTSEGNLPFFCSSSSFYAAVNISDKLM